MADSSNNSQNSAIAEAVQEVTAQTQVLVREGIELAKTEVTEKATTLARSAVIAVAAGTFAIFGLVLLLEGLAWLAWWALPVSSSQIFWGFLLVAFVLFLLGAIAGFIAARMFKKAKPPTPDLAIEEAKQIRATVEAHRPGGPA